MCDAPARGLEGGACLQKGDDHGAYGEVTAQRFPIAEYALLAHSMPGIAGSTQINHSGVLPGIRQHL